MKAQYIAYIAIAVIVIALCAAGGTLTYQAYVCDNPDQTKVMQCDVSSEGNGDQFCSGAMVSGAKCDVYGTCYTTSTSTSEK